MTFRRFCFPGSSPGKESACNAGDPSLIPESGRSARERIGYPLQCSWAFLVAQNQCGRSAKESTFSVSDLDLIHWRRDRLPTPVFLGFPCGSVGKESACNVGDLGLIPGLGRSPGEGN